MEVTKKDKIISAFEALLIVAKIMRDELTLPEMETTAREARILITHFLYSKLDMQAAEIAKETGISKRDVDYYLSKPVSSGQAMELMTINREYDNLLENFGVVQSWEAYYHNQQKEDKIYN